MPVSIIIGGQYGSEGKGKAALFWANKKNASGAVRVGGPNSGHTVYDESHNRHVFRQLPAACLKPNIASILPAGSYVIPKLLLDEIGAAGLPPERIAIDPNAVVVTDDMCLAECDAHMRDKIGSTQSGTGMAVAARVLRNDTAILAKDVPELSHLVRDTKKIMRKMLDDGCHIIIEGTQGYGLSNLHSPHYPYATARDTTAAGFLSEAGLSPFDVEHVVMVLRSYPIRVGGNSGPMENETTWDAVTKLAQADTPIQEYATVTERPRRVAHFDPKIVKQAIQANRPDVIILNHADYFDYSMHGKEDLSILQLIEVDQIAAMIGQKIDFIGNGPEAILPVAVTP